MTVDELMDILQDIRDKQQLVVDGNFNLITNVGESDDGYVYIAQEGLYRKYLRRQIIYLQNIEKSGWNNQTQNHVRGLNVYLTIVWTVC